MPEPAPPSSIQPGQHRHQGAPHERRWHRQLRADRRRTAPGDVSHRPL